MLEDIVNVKNLKKNKKYIKKFNFIFKNFFYIYKYIMETIIEIIVHGIEELGSIEQCKNYFQYVDEEYKNKLNNKQITKIEYDVHTNLINDVIKLLDEANKYIKIACETLNINIDNFKEYLKNNVSELNEVKEQN